jgi:hypothetical protein
MKAMALFDLGSILEINQILMTKITPLLVTNPRTLNSLYWIIVTSMKTLLQIKTTIHKIEI